MNHNLTSSERERFDEMMNQWGSHITKNRQLSQHYDGKVTLDDLGISIPPEIIPKVEKMSLMWSKQAVNRIADCSVIEGFDFQGETPAGFNEVLERNQFSTQYDESLPSELTHGLVFYTVTAGDIGEPQAIIASYDAEHATALYNYRKKQTDSGIAIVDVDIKDRNRPTAVNFYAPDGTIVEMERKSGSDERWVTRRLNSGTGRCAMEVMRNDPDLRKPYGRSVLTSAILQHESEANRQFVRSLLTAELGAAPQKWVMGVDNDFFDKDRWEAYLGSIFAIGGDAERLPTTGQYPQADMTQGVAYIRNLANQFAAEASIPIHSLLYTEANPASAEAIEASRHDLIEKVEKLNRINGHALRNVGLLVLSLLQETPVDKLGENERSLSVKWKNPLHPSLASSADAAQKIAAQVPGFAGTPTFWRMLGYNDSEIRVIESEIAANLAASHVDDEPEVVGGDDF